MKTIGFDHLDLSQLSSQRCLPFPQTVLRPKAKKLSTEYNKIIAGLARPQQRRVENELLYDRYHDKFHHVNAKSRREPNIIPRRPISLNG